MDGDRILGLRVTPITRRRLHNFRANRRGFWSLWIFLVLFFTSLFAELIANDKPLLVKFDGAYYVPFQRPIPRPCSAVISPPRPTIGTNSSSS